MACQIKTISLFSDFSTVKKCLFPDLQSDLTEIGWNEVNWDWNDNGNGADKKSEDQSWIQECFISFSPTGDALVMATTKKIIFLTMKWDMHEEGEVKAKFVMQWESELVEERREEISCVLCLPLASQKRSSQGGPDWTCVIVGFTTGHVKMFTETGVQLFSQIFHEGPVTRLKCRTYEPPRHAKSPEQQEELIILYPWAMVTIDGFSLFQTLRACRNQVAKATASRVEVITPPPLAYKKWGFQDQDRVVDCQHVGVMPSNMFDHLQTASLLGGFGASPRSSIPVASLILASGQAPYMGFYYAMEGSTQPLMSEVAIAVASKLKSVLFLAASGILGFGSKNAEEPKQLKQKIEPATPLACRFGMPDSRRLGDSIIISPNKSLAVVTDTFGRVVLIDINQGIAVRMWKGYRDAQCGWIEVVEDTHRQDKEKVTPVPRIALFLVIYAPRRGLLEVWTTQQGPRIAAFNVSKWARLVHPGYGLMGINSVSAIHQRQQSAQCFLLDPDGSVKTIYVPFHYALSDKNSKRAQSLHLLKKMKITLKEHASELGEERFTTSITKIVVDIKTPSIRQQALETLTANSRVSFELLDSVVAALLEQLLSQEPDSLDFESKLLLQTCQRLNQLLQVYSTVSKINVTYSKTVLPACDLVDSPIPALAVVLYLSEAEISQSLTLLKYQKGLAKPKGVTFADDKEVTPSSFLSCFSIFASHLNKEQLLRDTALPIEIIADISVEKLSVLGNYLFYACIFGDDCIHDLQAALTDSGILPEKMLSLATHFWLSMSFELNSYQCLLNLSSVVKYISSLPASQLVTVTYNEVSPWWQNVRSVLSQATNASMAYSAAIVCRGVALMLASCMQDLDGKPAIKKEKMSDSKGSEENLTLADWESISMDALQWNILVKQLEDVLVLSMLLGYQPLSSRGYDICREEISLNSLMEKGRGVVSELVAEWLIKTCMDQRLLKAEVKKAKVDIEDAKEAMFDDFCGDHTTKCSELLKMVQKRFPFSLETDILVANCAWEHAVLWNKDPDDVEHFQGALKSITLLSNAILKHGLISMIWHMFVSKQFTAAALLMEKTGKVPKDRLCRRDIGISESSLDKFLELCSELLDTLIEASVACVVESNPSFECEEFWQNRQGTTPLVELAVGQKLTNRELVCHHYQLSLCMHMMAAFSLRSVRPISFFDSKGKSAFFRELHSIPPLPMQDLDLAIINARTQFLSKVISAAVQSLPEPVPEAPMLENMSSSAVAVDQTSLSHWIGRVMDLAKLWGLDTDILRRHHVCELYSSGLDSMAEEVIPAVNDKVVMGSQLILLAGQRLYSAIRDRYKSVEVLSRLSPNVATWLRTLDQTTLRTLNPSLTMTATLISHVINQLPEGHSEYQMATALVDAVHSLMDLQIEGARENTNTG